MFVDADPEKIAWGRAHGVGVDQHPPQAAEFQRFADWTPPPEATVLLCTKCYDNATVLARLPTGTRLIPIQNGFDRLLQDYKEAGEGIASFVSECSPHRTHARITRGGRLHLGYQGVARAGTVRDGQLPKLAGLLRQTGLFRIEVVPDILLYKHTKLMYNAAIGPLAAAAGLDNGGLLAIPAARRLFFALLQENYSILHGAAVSLGKIGPFHPVTVQRILRRAVVARALSWAFYPSLRGTYCSMHADLPAGRSEIDYYNGYLIEVAADRPCPLNRRVHALVKRMEQERLAPGLSRLDELMELATPLRGSPTTVTCGAIPRAHH
jgi:2-dehydropantoate 2-reductase